MSDATGDDAPPQTGPPQSQGQEMSTEGHPQEGQGHETLPGTVPAGAYAGSTSAGTNGADADLGRPSVRMRLFQDDEPPPQSMMESGTLQRGDGRQGGQSADSATASKMAGFDSQSLVKEDSGLGTMLASGHHTVRSTDMEGSNVPLAEQLAARNNSEPLKLSDLFSPMNSQASLVSSLRQSIQEASRDNSRLEDSLDEDKFNISGEVIDNVSSISHQMSALEPRSVHFDLEAMDHDGPSRHQLQRHEQLSHDSHIDQSHQSIVQLQEHTGSQNTLNLLNPDDTVEGHSPDFKWHKLSSGAATQQQGPSELSTPTKARGHQQRAPAVSVPEHRGSRVSDISPDVSTVTSGDQAQSESTDYSSVDRLRLYVQQMLQDTADNIPDKLAYDQSNLSGDLLLGGAYHNLTNLSAGSGHPSSLYLQWRLADPPVDLSALQGRQDRSGLHQVAHQVSHSAEGRTLQVELEKEIYRRKHCETQIQKLQSKILELQQQVAVSVSTERRKDMLISQLDQSLGQAVEGMKKRDQEKQKKLEQQDKEIRRLTGLLQQQQTKNTELDRAMKHTKLSLATEQKRAAQAEADKQSRVQQLEQARQQLTSDLQHEKQTSHANQVALESVTRERDQLTGDLQDAQCSLAQEREIWDEKEKEYLQKIEEITENNVAAMKKEKGKTAAQMQIVEETQKVLQAAQKEVKSLEIQLDTAIREKESLRVEMGLMEAKLESSKRRLEADLQAQMERKIAEKVEEAHERQSESEARLREQHRRHVTELNQRHSQEIEQQLQSYHDDLRAKDAHLKEQVDMYEQKLSEARAEIDTLRSSNKKLDAYRYEITSKLQATMQALCDESAQMLASSDGHTRPLTTFQTVLTSSVVDSPPTNAGHVTTSNVLRPVIHQDTTHHTQPHNTRDQPLSAFHSGEQQLNLFPQTTVSTAASASGRPSMGIQMLNHNLEKVSVSSTGFQPASFLPQTLKPQPLQPTSASLQTQMTSSAFQPIMRVQAESEQHEGLSSQLHHDVVRPNAQLPMDSQLLVQSNVQLPPTSQTLSHDSKLQADWLSMLSQNYGIPKHLMPSAGQDGNLNTSNSSSQGQAQSQGGHVFSDNISIHQPTFVHEVPSAKSTQQQEFAPQSHITINEAAQYEDHSSVRLSTGPLEDSLMEQPSVSHGLYRVEALDYSKVSEKFSEHDARQRELQHYLKLALGRPSSPGSHGSHNDSKGSPRAPDGNTEPPFNLQPKPFLLKELVNDTQQDGQKTPETIHYQEDPPPGVLSPKDVGEIARLLQAYKDNSGTESQDPPIRELLSYMKQTQESPEQPTHDTEEHERYSPQGESQPAGSLPKARRNLSTSYDHHDRQQIVKIPTGEPASKSTHPVPGSSRPSKPGMQQTTVIRKDEPHRPSQPQTAANIKGAPAKKVDRKTAPPVKRHQAKGGEKVWR